MERKWVKWILIFNVFIFNISPLLGAVHGFIPLLFHTSTRMPTSAMDGEVFLSWILNWRSRSTKTQTQGSPPASIPVFREFSTCIITPLIDLVIRVTPQGVQSDHLRMGLFLRTWNPWISSEAFYRLKLPQKPPKCLFLIRLNTKKTLVQTDINEYNQITENEIIFKECRVIEIINKTSKTLLCTG